jgi:UDP-2,3-diacylglucosamine hydrolase
MIHFVSDIHLSPQTPEIASRFLAYLNGHARHTESLFILGDLFEVWTGDDCIHMQENSFNRRIVEALAALTDSGVELSIMHGNRDFLLGREFSAQTGARLIPDPYVLSLPTWQFVLSHGDMLCADDADYLAFRSQVRTPEWRDAFLSKPLKEREAIAATFRRQSEAVKQTRGQNDLSDLDSRAVDDFLRQQGYATFIHGHTHLPATHEHHVDGIRVERWVLSDWHEDRGEYLCWDNEQLTRHSV